MEASYKSHYAYSSRNPDIAIDPVDPATGKLTCLAAFINDPLLLHEPNVQFSHRGNRVYIRALQGIRPHEELFINYGADYWQDASQPSHLRHQAHTYYEREVATAASPRRGIG